MVDEQLNIWEDTIAEEKFTVTTQFRQQLTGLGEIMTKSWQWTLIYIDSLVYLDEFDPVYVEHPSDPDDGAM